MSSGFRLLCETAEIAPGSVKKVVLGGKKLAVFNLDGEFFVTDDTCTHGFASLSEGLVDEDVVICPWHGGTFDIRSGAPVEAPCTIPLTVYRCAVRDGCVWADLVSEPATAQALQQGG